jgi:hypothetical protein
MSSTAPTSIIDDFFSPIIDDELSERFLILDKLSGHVNAHENLHLRVRSGK